ncbi:MAG: J domain-containing protein [Vicinamibacterales bacterium]
MRSRGEVQKTARGNLFVPCQTSRGVVAVWGSPSNRRNIKQVESLSLPARVKANCIPSNWPEHVWWLPEKSTIAQGTGGTRPDNNGSRQPEPPGRKPFDPYAVLGIRPGATIEQIKAAYRTKIKEYHPDQVERLGPELRELAKRKTQEINRALEMLAR